MGLHTSVHAVGKYHGQMVSADIAYRPCFTAYRRKVVEIRSFHAGNVRMVPATCNIVHQLACHGNLGFRFFTQRDTDRIAQPVSQQCADAQSRFDTSVFSVSGFRYTEMQRNRIPSCSMTAASKRTVFTMTTVLDALMEMTTSVKFSCTQMRRNSIQDSTMPSGVSP